MKNIFLWAVLVIALMCISPFSASADDDGLLPCTITSFKAVPASVISGGSATLKWVTENCMTNLITQNSNPVISSALPSGFVSTGPLISAKTYLLTAIGDTNSATATITVTVGTTTPCSIIFFTANPSSIAYNSASTFSWSTQNCTSVSISPTVGVVPVNGSISSGNLLQTTLFTLTASNVTNTTTATKIVTVVPPPQCAISIFNATPQTITTGQATVLNWKTTNCNSGSIDQGVGSITPTIVQGSIATATLSQTTLFKLTATGIANTATAQTTVNVAPPACIPDTWTQKADFGGTARSGAVGFAIGSKGYIGTGNDASGLKKDFWEYNPTTNTWAQKSNFAGIARKDAVGFSIDAKGYIGTGQKSNTKYKDFWEYNPATNIWTQKADFAGDARHSAVGFAIGSKGYIGTGQSQNTGVNQYHKDFWEYNPLTNIWTQKADFGGTARKGAIGFKIGDKGYVGTGHNTFVGAFNDLWEYNSQTDMWMEKMNASIIGWHESVVMPINYKTYIGTGHNLDGPYHSFLWEYDQTTNMWTEKANFAGTSRQSAVGFSVNGKGYLGTGDDGNLKKDFWEYCP